MYGMLCVSRSWPLDGADEGWMIQRGTVHGVSEFRLPQSKSIDGLAVDPQPDWTFDSLLIELSPIEKKLDTSSMFPVPFTKFRSRELSIMKDIRRSPRTFAIHISDYEIEDVGSDGDGDGDGEAREQFLVLGRRFACDKLYISDSDDSGDESAIETQYHLMDKVGLVEGAFLELTHEYHISIMEEIRNQILALETDLMSENEKFTSALARVEKHTEARRDMDRKLNMQYQRKIMISAMAELKSCSDASHPTGLVLIFLVLLVASHFLIFILADWATVQTKTDATFLSISVPSSSLGKMGSTSFLIGFSSRVSEGVVALEFAGATLMAVGFPRLCCLCPSLVCNEALDNHLTAIQRVHEHRSQIEESRIRDDAAFEESKRKEKALQEEKLRREKIRAEAEARLEAEKKRAEEAKAAALEAERRAAKEAAEKVVTENLRRASAALVPLKEADGLQTGSGSNIMQKATSAGNVFQGAARALELEGRRLQIYNEVAAQKKALGLDSNKDYRSHGKQIARQIRTISGSKGNVRAKTDELIKIFFIDSPWPQTTSVAMFAEKVVARCMNSIESIFAYGHVIALVSAQVPLTMDLLLAELNRVCIFTVPKYINNSESVFDTEETYKKAIGFQEEDGKIESKYDYLKQMVSYMKLYGALVQFLKNTCYGGHKLGASKICMVWKKVGHGLQDS
ncbi:mRNA export factor GLE1-like [Cornus florida]|uniref:mRNA export factor GLE1-like n=1 Tax=Cornus florida TaxID=4283 RepID=UPI00289AD915|nr:mRNA export factor GLE1-like [Cornus florida]